MYICYIDESGTSAVPGNTSHFVLAGLSIPIARWHDADAQISEILKRYGLGNEELHTAWMLRKYLEQSRIPNFDRLDYDARRAVAERERNAFLLQLQRSQNTTRYRQAKKNLKHTQPYIHLTLAERTAAVREVAKCVASWDFATLFAECINKLFFDARKTGRDIDEQALEQLVSRFEHYLKRDSVKAQNSFGLLVHDNNETVAKKHTELMRAFHSDGTLWTGIGHIIETPLFVDSRLTRMVQLADLCSYALRRFVENDEKDLFEIIFKRADRLGRTAVGVRHYTEMSCSCAICRAHKANGAPRLSRQVRRSLPPTVKNATQPAGKPF